jgi:large conductance mechanosensitive channel
VALAIAVVVGTALTVLVKALVDDFIMPIIVAIGPGGDWQKATWSVGSVKFGIGDFSAAVINFIIIGFVAWRISKIFIKPEAVAPVKPCPYCRMSMDPAATRCPHCTSQLGQA